MRDHSQIPELEVALAQLPPSAAESHAIIHQQLYLIHKDRLAYREALFHAQQAVQYRPKSFAAWGNLGNLQRDLQNFPQAMASYEQALRYCDNKVSRAQLRFNQALAQLAAGDYARGALGFLAKVEGGNELQPKGLQTLPRWRGESLVGKRVLIHALEGFGDCLQWLRFVPSFQSHTRCAFVGVCPHPELSRLLLSESAYATGFHIETTFTLFKDGTTALQAQAFDLWLPLYALLHLCKAQPHALSEPWKALFPATVPRLGSSVKVSSVKVSSLKIGVVWQANPLAPTAQRRNCPFEILQGFMTAFLLRHPRLTFYSFQYAPDAASQLALQKAAQALPLVDLNPQLQGFEQTAGFLRQMDALITVDTVVAHLSAALAVPTHLLLSYVADWRWLSRERNQSPWYPDTHSYFQLYRQREPGNWVEVLERVQKGLDAQLKSRSYIPN